MSFNVAKNFASIGETDVLDQVILSITFENKEGKYFICLDRLDYTVYLDEYEVLLQAGLRGKVESYEEIKGDEELTIFNLYVSDEMVKKEMRKRTKDFVYPVFFYGL